KCQECQHLPLLCLECWVKVHTHNPLHWAFIWSAEEGYFVKHDISILGYPIPLHCAGSNHCPRLKQPQGFIIADINGVHLTRVEFCNCAQEMHMDKWTQLFKLDIFPFMVNRPQSGFTFELLQHYEMLVKQAQVTSHQFMLSL
ncbi:hypothetical protein L218DRAFT_881163, partial [Marasmius fiardii PR-910]